MAHINTGAYVDGRRPASKAALRRAVVDNLSAVTFDVTALFGPYVGMYLAATPADIGADQLSVVGPDPYRSRRWYATVEVGRDGRVKVR